MKKELMKLAERCVGEMPKGSRWKRDDRVALVYAVLYKLSNANKNKNIKIKK